MNAMLKKKKQHAYNDKLHFVLKNHRFYNYFLNYCKLLADIVYKW